MVLHLVPVAVVLEATAVVLEAAAVVLEAVEMMSFSLEDQVRGNSGWIYMLPSLHLALS
jgi:hypothetical protein